MRQKRRTTALMTIQYLFAIIAILTFKEVYMTKKQKFAKFIGEQFSGCDFCKKFGYDKTCPLTLKGFYKPNEEPSDAKVSKGAKICRNHIMQGVEECLAS